MQSAVNDDAGDMEKDSEAKPIFFEHASACQYRPSAKYSAFQVSLSLDAFASSLFSQPSAHLWMPMLLRP